MGLGRCRLEITGVVQGVGFRPFVFLLAERLGLAGYVGNDSRGVHVEVEGRAGDLDAFVEELRLHPPPLARIDSVAVTSIAMEGGAGFEIRESDQIAGESTPVSPDIATCAECLAEMLDPLNRRYRYPFLNCTNCGPRFTITRGVPYDRALTTMAAFPMCADCEREYKDPRDRRYHAQPTACPVCGPQLSFHPSGEIGEDALQTARRMLLAGGIVAIKGIGGFHLACDATNGAAVDELRRRKGRAGKPFAVLARDLAMVREFAIVDDAALLESRERPIVLFPRVPQKLAEGVAPGHSQHGFFLPYSPLHHLLMEDMSPLVMTSGNRSDEPIARENDEALERLRDLADGFLLHNREIHVVCDDSVVRGATPIRRSRGYAPLPVRLPSSSGANILAVGGELKATFCLAKGERAYMSQHIGDMENIETLQAFERSLQQMRALFRVSKLDAIAADLHPGYISTQWALRQAGVPVVQIQHHHAHIASLLAESGLDEQILGLSFDGTGYGADGAIWGGELLLADLRSFTRLAHLRYVPMVGGDGSVKRPYRMALAHLAAAGIDWDEDLPCVRACPASERLVLQQLLQKTLNCADTSSFGRLFDAAASLCGVRHTVTYEAQGAMEFEAIADEAEGGSYEFGLSGGTFDPAPVWIQMIADLRSGATVPAISMRFHRAVAGLIGRACTQTGSAPTVALSGGVFQNALLVRLARETLEKQGFRVLTHTVVPPNDGGLALGQAAIAAARGPALKR
jgi:hydrogenase maturation protein HypF